MGKARIALVVLYIMQCSVGNADYPKQIEASTRNKYIKVGQPLILRLAYRFERPQFSPVSNEILTSIGPEATVQIKNNNKEILEPSYHHLAPYGLYPQDKKGLTYSGDFILFYDDFKKKLIFDKPGIYEITVRVTDTKTSNPLDITVKPASQSEEKLLSLLSDPSDYAFLLHGGDEHFKKRPERISHLKQAIEQFESNVLAKMGAARLGLEYFKQFHAKHPSFEKFKEKYQQGQIKEPLFEQARKYLTIGAELPDEFPIREQILRQLTITEFVESNYEKADSLLDELGAKYPHGKYGKRTADAKKELQKFREQESGKHQQPVATALWARRLFWIATVGVTVIVLGGLILLLSKKSIVRGK